MSEMKSLKKHAQLSQRHAKLMIFTKENGSNVVSEQMP